MMYKKRMFFFLSLFLSVSVNSEPLDQCPMDIHPIDLTHVPVAYDYFDAGRAEHLVGLSNGDLVVVRYNSDCGLGLDITYLSVDGLNDRNARIEKASWLISIFRNYESINQQVKQQLSRSKALDKSEFYLSIPGEYGDEEHVISLKDISVANDFQSLLFRNMMTYSWLPPSGE